MWNGGRGESFAQDVNHCWFCGWQRRCTGLQASQAQELHKARVIRRTLESVTQCKGGEVVLQVQETTARRDQASSLSAGPHLTSKRSRMIRRYSPSEVTAISWINFFTDEATSSSPSGPVMAANRRSSCGGGKIESDEETARVRRGECRVRIAWNCQRAEIAALTAAIPLAVAPFLALAFFAPRTPRQLSAPQ